MEKIFTIGFTQKTAEEFFKLLIANNIQTVIDIRLNNTSQLAAFSKFPDIQYFLKELCNIAYIHDIQLSPEENTLKNFKKKDIDWNTYVKEFEETMVKRNINKHIEKNYFSLKNICLLCSEPTAENCHRSIIAQKFVQCFSNNTIINL